MEEKKISLGRIRFYDGDEQPRELILVRGKRGYIELRFDNHNQTHITVLESGLGGIKRNSITRDSKIFGIEKSLLCQVDDIIEKSTRMMDSIDNTAYWQRCGIITEDETLTLECIRKAVAARAWKAVTNLLGVENE